MTVFFMRIILSAQVVGSFFLKSPRVAGSPALRIGERRLSDVLGVLVKSQTVP